MSHPILKLIQKEEIQSVDLRFTDTIGKEQHITIPARTVDETFLQRGKAFDGSSIQGWKHIHESDMLLIPDVEVAYIDPFFETKTLNIQCDVVDPSAKLAPYDRCPRTIAKRAEAYLKSTGIADEVYVGPEIEFFIFDDVRFEVGINKASYHIDSYEGAWNSNTIYPEGPNLGHRPGIKGGYFPVPPVDSSQDIRSEMCRVLEQVGLVVEAHHHEVATANQNEIGTRFNTLTRKGDELQRLKYVLHNVAHQFGKTVTFMPKPLVGDNGSGMHCHQSLAKDGRNIFAGDGYAGLSEEALFYIGGIIKHARALNAFTNASTNSYRRLVPGFEAPILLAYSGGNRSAAIRIPYEPSPKGKRIEVRFPDAAGNPYLIFTALLMAGLDGIKQRIHPGDAIDVDLYELMEKGESTVPTVCADLAQALEALGQDHQFLLQGNVFSKDFIRSYIELKQKEVTRVRMCVSPVEFEMYYSL